MKKPLCFVTILLLVLTGGSAFALSVASERVIEAFNRYEPDFSNSLRRFEELVRKVENQNIDLNSGKYKDIAAEADDIMNYVQKRYDLMEDLFTTVSGNYPQDRAELFENFSRIDDIYRETRNFYLERFVNGNTTKPADSKKMKDSASAPVPAVASDDKIVATTEKGVEKAQKFEISGTLKLDFRNRNEVYRTQTKTLPFTNLETALPNNLSQAKLNLSYEIDQNRKLFLENRFLRRERNEQVHENYLTLAYLYKITQKQIWTFKNTLHHSWYPDNGAKDYRDNLTEIFFNDRWSKRERLANLGYQSRVYPHYTRADYHQFNLSEQETWFIKNGNIFAELKGNWRRYRNVDNLDYDNFNFYGEYNKTYSGNKADLSISNTYERRMYDREAIDLYRASYWDNYLRINYDLPVHDKLTYLIEGEYQKRNYLADEPRGYAQINFFSAAKLKFNKNTRGQLDYRYIFNDENTTLRAHKNYKLHGMWQRKVNDQFKIRVDDTFHVRTSVQGEVMDFKENLINTKLSWALQNGIAMIWNNEYLSRIYDQIVYRDFRYFLTGLVFSYAHGRKYNWKFEQSWRKFSFRNGNNISTGWESETQPLTEVRYNVALNDELKLKLRASWEKTFYRQFDSRSQELLWEFTKPMTITEFYGGLEYEF